MRSEPGRTIVHLIEPQHLFVPALIETFSEAGLFVDFVSGALDPRRLLEDQPNLVFLDTDFLPEPLETVRLAHVLAPNARIFVYANATTDTMRRSFTAVGADLVLTKSAARGEIVQGLREMDRRWRLPRTTE